MNFAKTKERVLTKTFDWKYNDIDGQEAVESVTFSYFEKCLTPAFMDSLSQFEQTRNASHIGQQLSEAITEWDLDWNGEPFPPSFENLTTKCDVDFVMELVNQMSESFSGNGQTPSVSQNGSAGLAKSRTAKVS